MHKTAAIAALVLLTLAPVAGEAQTTNPQSGTVSATAQPAPVPLSPVTVLRPDTISLGALRTRLDELERRQSDPLTEQIKWGAFAAIGIAFAIAWVLVRRTEKEERGETTLREVMKELMKNPSAAADIETRLKELDKRLADAAGKVANLEISAATMLSKINIHLSGASTRPPGTQA